MKKVSKDRAAIEQAEGLKTNTVDAPEERFQKQQQVSSTMDSGNNTVDTEGFTPKKSKSSGTVLRQEVAAQVIKGKGAPGVADGVASPATFGLKEISFSGDTGTILGSASGTPSMGRDYQGASRVDKRLSDANKDINFNACEQIVNEYDNIPALADSESTVGYNGNAKNIAARMQKKNGLTSAETLFDRSIDFIEKDAAVFVSGQVVKQSNEWDEAYPTKTIDYDRTSDTFGKLVDFAVGENDETKGPVRGNYMPKEIRVEFTKDASGAYVSRFEVIEDNISCNNESDQVVNISATNHKIDLNRAELARQTIDAEAGSPTSQHFNPLGRSVSQPTATMTYLQDLENATGATIFAAYKFANKARGHYLNRTAKDGQYITEPAVDALYGHLYGANDYDELIELMGGLDDDSPLFNHISNRYGSAALMIPVFDSVGKYKTKGDLVNQPRSLKMHIQTADNNMDPFRCKKEFVAALNSIDAYSTIDHDYDPLSPVYMTDNVRLVYPYSWRKALKYTRASRSDNSFDSQVPAYSYSAGSGMNKYIVAMGDPVLNGVSFFLNQHANAIYNALVHKGDSVSNNTVALSIPTVHSTTHFSLWDLIVCASTPYIIYERTNAMKDVLDFEAFYKYPFQGNVAIKDAQPTLAVNYANPSTTSPLTVKQMMPSSAIRWKYPEMFTHLPGGILYPYYFNERSYDFTTEGKDSKLVWNGDSNFTTPIIRSGMKLGGLDDFFGMEVKDNLLVNDVMTRLPGLAADAEFEGHIYKYSNEADGCIMVREDAVDGKTAVDYLSTPRQLGWYIDLPAGLGCAYGVSMGLKDASSIDFVDIRPSFRAVMYKGTVDSYTGPESILAPGSVNVSRAQSFKQKWFMCRAGSEADGSVGFDLPMSVCDGFQRTVIDGDVHYASIDNYTAFLPFMFGRYSVQDGRTKYAAGTLYSSGENDRPVVFSIHRVLWPLLQKTCFVLNPFDNAGDHDVFVDPFTIPYVFGLAGFMAANFDEELYNRINEVQNQGYGYTRDPMTAASPIFKDAYAKTQIG